MFEIPWLWGKLINYEKFCSLHDSRSEKKKKAVQKSQLGNYFIIEKHSSQCTVITPHVSTQFGRWTCLRETIIALVGPSTKYIESHCEMKHIHVDYKFKWLSMNLLYKCSTGCRAATINLLLCRWRSWNFKHQKLVMSIWIWAIKQPGCAKATKPGACRRMKARALSVAIKWESIHPFYD